MVVPFHSISLSHFHSTQSLCSHNRYSPVSLLQRYKIPIPFPPYPTVLTFHRTFFNSSYFYNLFKFYQSFSFSATLSQYFISHQTVLIRTNMLILYHPIIFRYNHNDYFSVQLYILYQSISHPPHTPQWLSTSYYIIGVHHYEKDNTVFTIFQFYFRFYFRFYFQFYLINKKQF